MTEKRLNHLYFDWMCRLVCTASQKTSYLNLLHQLNEIDFEYTIPIDGNRAEDGIDLRYRFGYENSYPDSMIATYLDNRPCSVLEMLVALALRIEEQIMSDPDLGNRTGTWFWGMIANLGLSPMDESNYDAEYVDDVIFRFMAHQYKRNGEGGLFTVNDGRHDLRSTEIWYQMNWYLSDKY